MDQPDFANAIVMLKQHNFLSVLHEWNESKASSVGIMYSLFLAWASIARGNAKLLTKVVSLLLVIRIDQKLYV